MAMGSWSFKELDSYDIESSRPTLACNFDQRHPMQKENGSHPTIHIQAKLPGALQLHCRADQ